MTDIFGHLSIAFFLVICDIRLFAGTLCSHGNVHSEFSGAKAFCVCLRSKDELFLIYHYWFRKIILQLKACRGVSQPETCTYRAN